MATLRNEEILDRYSKKLEQAKRKVRPAMMRVYRATHTLKMRMDDVDYLAKQLQAVVDCMARGVPFRQPKARTGKKLRAVQLD